jgi:His-Xaa-Ser system radical SAM maturase HxsC
MDSITPIRIDLFEEDVVLGIEPGYYRLSKGTSAAPEKDFQKLLNGIRICSDDIEYQAVRDHVPDAYCILNEHIYSSFDDGDIGYVTAKGRMRIVLAQRENHNSILVTEECDNLCLFCSQPPKKEQDTWLWKQALYAVCTFQSKQTIGITGGEPLLRKDLMLSFLDGVKQLSSCTPLHILTNGRGLADTAFSRALFEKTKGLTVTLGVPVHSMNPIIHDTISGAQSSHQETIKGLINAGNLGINIELRIIPVVQNVNQIKQIIEFAARCLSNVVQVSIMNLEPTGWAKKNWDELYVSPNLLHLELEESVKLSSQAGLPVKLFNYPLCQLSPLLREFAVKSISDWKNYYPKPCQPCLLKSDCTGLFSSARGKFIPNIRSVLDHEK